MCLKIVLEIKVLLLEIIVIFVRDGVRDPLKKAEKFPSQPI